MVKCFWRALSFLLFHAAVAASGEHISDFYLDLTMHPDGRIDIVETIRVLSQGRQIKRGIIREIPTVYQDMGGTHYTVDCVLQQIMHNDQRASYRTESFTNGVRIFIGNEKILLNPGYHTYTIAYSTNRQIGYFEDHDELFWNVTGNGWKLPIAQARFTIRLPPEIPIDSLRTRGYTGYRGDQGTDYTTQVCSNGIIVGQTTRGLQPYEGLSIALAWPKGYTIEPTWQTVLYYFIYDNVLLIILFVLLVICFIAYTVMWFKTRSLFPAGTIIPLFYPPSALCPAQVCCIDAMKYENRALTASIINLAVQGVLKIEHKEIKDIFSSRSYYVLHKLVDCNHPSALRLHHYEQQLFKSLFSGEQTICKLNGQDSTVPMGIAAFQKSITLNFTIQNIVDNWQEERSHLYWFSGYILLLVAIFGVGMARFAWIMDGWFWVLSAVLVIIHMWGAWLIKHYTQRGRQLHDQIEGFKLFLNITEKDRMNMIGTPPEETPHLYETYLPYAIALGVEEQWTKKFEAIFAQMQAAHAPYIPVWYSGRINFISHPRVYTHMIRTFNTSVSSSIAAGYKPGLYSVFGKGGSGGGGGGAGRGGGGGGGGGW